MSEVRGDSDDVRLARLEQKVDDLRDLMMVGFQNVDRRFEEVDRRFDEVDRRFVEMDIRTDRRFEEAEKREDRSFEEAEKREDRRFEEAERREDRRFESVGQRFDDLDKRLDRERMERWAFVVAVGGSLAAALLRLFGAI